MKNKNKWESNKVKVKLLEEDYADEDCINDGDSLLEECSDESFSIAEEMIDTVEFFKQYKETLVICTDMQVALGIINSHRLMKLKSTIILRAMVEDWDYDSIIRELN